MPMWTMNLRGLSAGKDLAGVTQERPLPLKSRTQCTAAHTLAFSILPYAELFGGRTLYHL